jgi:hypothetical protein
MKYTERHGLIWSRVDRIQTAPDMRKAERMIQRGSDERELKNAFRL